MDFSRRNYAREDAAYNWPKERLLELVNEDRKD
jgi:hypothetical protein